MIQKPSEWLISRVKAYQRRNNHLLKLREEFWGKRFETMHSGNWARETREDARLWNEIAEALGIDPETETNKDDIKTAYPGYAGDPPGSDGGSDY